MAFGFLFLNINKDVSWNTEIRETSVFTPKPKFVDPKNIYIYIYMLYHVQYSVNLEYEKIYHLFLVSIIQYSTNVAQYIFCCAKPNF